MAIEISDGNFLCLWKISFIKEPLVNLFIILPYLFENNIISFKRKIGRFFYNDTASILATLMTKCVLTYSFNS